MAEQTNSNLNLDRIGEFVVLAYHDVPDASSLHAQLKQRSIDAAVIDSAYILSRLHLAAALHRITQQPLALDAGEPRPPPAPPRQRAREVFSALSHMRNLDRVLQRLTCAETTRAIVIVLPDPPVEHIAAARSAVRGTQHDLHALGAYTDAALVADFYGLPCCDNATLEASVVNRLATHDWMTFACRLSSRVLIRVSGVGAHELLQGLFTNDLRDLHPGGSMWGCFLHHTGRVLADAYLYQSARVHNEQSCVLVDVHRDMAEAVEEHLLEMRMRKKAQIENVSASLSLFASTNESGPPVSPAHVESFPDPRSFALPVPLRKTIVPADVAPVSSDTPELYRAFLCAAGIGEGPHVFRPNKSLPFEANTDFLKGVSFKKGCYLGQELTHRTHVMLVTRKRTVPLRFPSLNRPVEIGERLLMNGQEVGTVLDACGDVGLGLIRLRYVDAETRSAPGLALHDAVPVEMTIPNWWPEAEVKKMLLKQ